MRFTFDDFVVDAAARLLTRRDLPVRLSPKAFDLLVALLEARPRVLTKSDLHGRLWPGVYVSDASLAMLVAELRAALGEDARCPQFVRTVHRHGYAFQALANTVPEAPGPSASHGARKCWIVTPAGHVPLLPGENLVGRDPSARILLDTPSVSRRHARIVVEGERAMLEDLGSKNGTTVGSVRVTGALELQDEAEVRFGSASVVFRASAVDVTISDTDAG